MLLIFSLRTSFMTELLIRKSIDVAAPVETLWKILTDSEFIRQYMFGCNAETDWKPGSTLLWRGAADGVVYVKGHVVRFEPARALEYTIFDPNSKLADIPSNYLTMKLRPQRGPPGKIDSRDYAGRLLQGRRRTRADTGIHSTETIRYCKESRRLAEAQVRPG